MKSSGWGNAGKSQLNNPASRRNQRITFQKNTVTNDEFDNRIQIWVDYFSCWAYANTIQSSETNGDVPQERLPITFEAGFCPELAQVTSTDFRIVFNGEYYDILAVDRMNYQNSDLKFNCSRSNLYFQPGTSGTSFETDGEING